MVFTTLHLDSVNRPYAQVLEEYEDDNLKVFYAHGLDLISVEQDGEVSIYQVDGLGSTRVLTDLDGNVVASYTYEAFGELLDSTGDVENDYLFAGEQFDGELRQYYLRQRFYDAGVGRFTRRDVYEGRSEEPLTLHKYLYAHSDPVNGTDPSGYFTISEASTINKIISTLAVMNAGTNLVYTGSMSGIIHPDMTNEQRSKIMGAPYYREAIPYIEPEGEKDDKGRRCFVADVPRRGNSDYDRYEEYVSKSDSQFFGINRQAVAIMYDGREPGTRNVWETKYGYSKIPSNSFLTSMDIRRFEDERERGMQVASDCGYNYQWAFSEKNPYNYVKNL